MMKHLLWIGVLFVAMQGAAQCDSTYNLLDIDWEGSDLIDADGRPHRSVGSVYHNIGGSTPRELTWRLIEIPTDDNDFEILFKYAIKYVSLPGFAGCYKIVVSMVLERTGEVTNVRLLKNVPKESQCCDEQWKLIKEPPSVSPRDEAVELIFEFETESYCVPLVEKEGPLDLSKQERRELKRKSNKK